MAKEREDGMLEVKKCIMAALRAQDIIKVVVEYEGSGDSGDIQNVTAYRKGKKKISPEEDHEPTSDSGNTVKLSGNIKYKSLKSDWNEKKKKYIHSFTEEDKSLEDACSDFASEYLSHLGIDWYNNEGGFGDIEINVTSNKVIAHHNARVESSEYYEHEL